MSAPKSKLVEFFETHVRAAKTMKATHDLLMKKKPATKPKPKPSPKTLSGY